MHIDKMCLQQSAMQMLRGNTVPSPWGELTKYKCLVPAQNRLPNVLVEEVEGGLNNLEIKLFVVFIFIMIFLHMCEILECCIVGFYPIVFYLAHIVALYTFIVLLSYLMLVIYTSVPLAHFVEGDKI